MSLGGPDEVFAAEREPGKWQLVDYETATGIRGKMAYAETDAEAPPLSLTLNVRGTYKIYVGINYTPDGTNDYGSTCVKLEDDLGYTRFTLESAGKNAVDFEKLKPIGVGSSIYNSIHETLWRVCDVDDTRVMIKPAEVPYEGGLANVSYIKLEPLTDEESAIWGGLNDTTNTRSLHMLWCAGQLTGHTMGTRFYHPDNTQMFRDEMQHVINSDIGTFVFEGVRGNMCCFKTETGDVDPDTREWNERWLDPLEEFSRLSREVGLRIMVSMRLIGAGYPTNTAAICKASFFYDHPELAKRDQLGVRASNLSLAYPQVRAHWVAIAREVLDGYGVDGIQLHLNRCAPFSLYEERSAAEFKDKYGRDLAAVEFDDPEYVQHRADYVTEFVREMKAEVDRKEGRVLGVTLYPIRSEAGSFDRIVDDCEPARWIREGIVDILTPSYTVDPGLIRFWKSIADYDLKVVPDMMPRTQTAPQYVRLARRYYDAGADGVAFWDGERRFTRCSEWAAASRLGHRDQLNYLEREGDDFFRRVPLTSLGGFAVGCSFGD